MKFTPWPLFITGSLLLVVILIVPKSTDAAGTLDINVNDSVQLLWNSSNVSNCSVTPIGYSDPQLATKNQYDDTRSYSPNFFTPGEGKAGTIFCDSPIYGTVDDRADLVVHPLPPASASASCDTSGSAANLSWAAASGANLYRVEVATAGACPAGWDQGSGGCGKTVTGTSVSFQTQAGVPYAWQVYSKTGSVNSFSPKQGSVFSCIPTNNPPIGDLNSVECDNIVGWTCDPDALSQALRVDVYRDGTYATGVMLTSGNANITREVAVGAACGGNPAHGFSIPMPASMRDGSSHSYSVYGIDSTGVGPNTLLGNRSKTCPAPVVPACGTANGAPTATQPSSNLCSGGSLTWSDTTAGDGFYNWSCGTALCSAPKSIAVTTGSCGTAHLTVRNSYTELSGSEKCLSGTPQAIDTIWPMSTGHYYGFQWKCMGSDSASSADDSGWCQVYKPPVCGSANNIPTLNQPADVSPSSMQVLCGIGQPYEMAPYGTAISTGWEWKCANSGSPLGTPVCRAPKFQCSDTRDNDTDGLTDIGDPGCHFDNNPANPLSYVPTDNDETNGTVPPGEPQSPQAFTATGAGSCGGQITISWSAATGADYYEVSTNGGVFGGNAWNVVPGGSTARSYTFTVLSPSQVYGGLYVRARNTAGGTSNQAGPVSARSSDACTTALSCGGSIPANNVAWDAEESTGLLGATSWTYSAVDNPGTKCEYHSTVCQATTINNCTLNQTNAGNSVNGSCSTSGTCTYTCRSDGTWREDVACTPAINLPDLVVVSFPQPMGAYTQNSPLQILGTMRNIGQTSTLLSFYNDFTYQWGGTSGPWLNFAGGSGLVHPQLVPGVAVGDGPVTFTPNQTGSLYLQYCVDSNNDIAEGVNENPNCRVIGPLAINPGTSGFSCTGSGFPNATAVPGDNVGLSQNTAYRLSTVDANTVAPCEYVCNSGYHFAGGQCVQNTFSCLPPVGSGFTAIPANTTYHFGDDTNLSSSPYMSYSANNTGAKCEFYCPAPFVWDQGRWQCNPVQTGAAQCSTTEYQCLAGQPFGTNWWETTSSYGTWFCRTSNSTESCSVLRPGTIDLQAANTAPVGTTDLTWTSVRDPQNCKLYVENPTGSGSSFVANVPNTSVSPYETISITQATTYKIICDGGVQDSVELKPGVRSYFREPNPPVVYQSVVNAGSGGAFTLTLDAYYADVCTYDLSRDGMVQRWNVSVDDAVSGFGGWQRRIISPTHKQYTFTDYGGFVGYISGTSTDLTWAFNCTGINGGSARSNPPSRTVKFINSTGGGPKRPATVYAGPDQHLPPGQNFTTLAGQIIDPDGWASYVSWLRYDPVTSLYANSSLSSSVIEDPSRLDSRVTNLNGLEDFVLVAQGETGEWRSSWVRIFPSNLVIKPDLVPDAFNVSSGPYTPNIPVSLSGRVTFKISSTPAAFFDNFSYQWDGDTNWTQIQEQQHPTGSYVSGIYVPTQADGPFNFTPNQNGKIRFQYCVDSKPATGGGAIDEGIDGENNNCVQSGLLTIGTGIPPGNPQCSNLVDDDGDGKIDFPQDPGCTDATDDDETDSAVPLPDLTVVNTGPAEGARYNNPGNITFTGTLMNSNAVTLTGQNVWADVEIDWNNANGCTAPSVDATRNAGGAWTSLAAGVPRGLSATLPAAALTNGTHCYRMIADRDNFVTESNDSNNAGTPWRTFIVAGLPSGNPQCSNGGVDDGDGKADFPQDPGCTDATDDDESDGGPSNSCTGVQPANTAAICAGDDTGVSGSVPRTAVGYNGCTAATKCEYPCVVGYVKSGNACVPANITTFEVCDADGTSNCVSSGGTKNVDAGAPILVRWNASNATFCNEVSGTGFTTGGSTNNTDAANAPATANINESYTIACGNGGQVSDTETVTIHTNPAGPTLAVNPRVVRARDTDDDRKVTVTWDTNNGNEALCTLVQTGSATNLLIPGGDPEQGSYLSQPINSRTTFTLTCQGLPPVSRTVEYSTSLIET